MTLVMTGLGGSCVRPIPLEDAEDTWAQTVCEYWNECECGELWTSCDEIARDDWRYLIEDATDEGKTYDGECLGRLVRAYDRRACHPSGHKSALDCRAACPVVYGALPKGASCTGGATYWMLSIRIEVSDCGQGLVCAAGQCMEPCDAVDRREGESCEFDRTSCADGLVCEDEVCRAQPGVGEPCAGPCDPRVAFCDISDDTCRALRSVGEACTAQDQCASGYCPNGRCALPPKRGEACTFACEEGSFCDLDVGLCVEPPAEVCFY
jgi:hypothetical protein